MKKYLIIYSSILVLLSFSAFCQEIDWEKIKDNRMDLALGFAYRNPTCGLFSMRIDRYSNFNLGYDYTGSEKRFTANGDKWYFKDRIVEKLLDFFLGFGVVVTLNPSSSDEKFPDTGCRVLFGLQLILAENFEIFGDVAPTAVVYPKNKFFVSGTIGIRYILKLKFL